MDILKGYTSQQIVDAIEHLDSLKLLSEMQESAPKPEDLKNLHVAQLLSCVTRYLDKPWSETMLTNYGITQTQKLAGIVTYKYVKTMLHKQPAFQQADEYALFYAVQTLKQQGKLKEILENKRWKVII